MLPRTGEFQVSANSGHAVTKDGLGELGFLHTNGVEAVAVGRLPDGTSVIVSGGGSSDGTVRVWRLADGIPVVPPLHLPESILAVAVYGNVIVTAAGADVAVHQPTFPWPSA